MITCCKELLNFTILEYTYLCGNMCMPIFHKVSSIKMLIIMSDIPKNFHDDSSCDHL